MRIVLTSCILIAVLGSGLYFAKLSVDDQYRILTQLQQEIKSQTEHNHVLQAEWTYLTRPERLLSLSQSLLGMDTIAPERILPISSIPMARTASPPSSNSKSGARNVVY